MKLRFKKELSTKKKEILAIIPARGGSKGIKRKNIKLLGGKPLLAYSALAALRSKFISKTILSTDDNEIANIGRDLGLEVPFMRSKLIAKDETPSLIVFKDVLNNLRKLLNYIPDIVIILQPTSPFRSEKHIDEAIDMFLSHDADSLVSVSEVPHNFSPHSVMRYVNNIYIKDYIHTNEYNNQRQKKQKFFARNGAAIYITTPDCILKKNSLFGNKIIGFKMSKLHSLDIDDKEDWIIAEALNSRKL